MSSPDDKRSRLEAQVSDEVDTAEQRPAESTSLFTEDEHAELDTLVNDQLEVINNKTLRALKLGLVDVHPYYRLFAASIVGTVCKYSKNRLRAGFVLDGHINNHPKFPPKELADMLEEDLDFFTAVLSAATIGQFKDIRDYDFLHSKSSASAPGSSPEVTAPEKIAVENSRSAKFFLKILQNYQADTLRLYYARFVTITQSSGTGKSRMIDEAGKEVILIPVNLSVAKPYPPSDPSIREWLIRSVAETAEVMYFRALALLYGLFTQTQICLEELAKSLLNESAHDGASTRRRLQRLASKLRDYFMKGMTFGEHGLNRRTFHKAVKDLAEEFFNSKAPLKGKPISPTQVGEADRVLKAASNLSAFIDPNRVLSDLAPTILLCFDESHDLIGPPACIACGKEVPMWAIFLSTAGKFHLFAPDRPMDPSERINTDELKTYDPITETGFDEFAERVVSGGPQSTLSSIASTHHMAHLGRALFAARFDEGSPSVRKSIVSFARAKLLGYFEGHEPGTMPDAAKLACLAVRLGLDFRAASSQGAEAQRVQVERHMRIALFASASDLRMVTTSSSEPLLAEASCITMRASKDWTAADSLRKHFRSSEISLGDRGEFAVALLALLARDAAVAQNSNAVQETTTLQQDGAQRVITVTGFLKALLETSDGELVAQPPTSYRESDTAFHSLEDTFEDGKIWFNHFVRVDDYDVINQEFLWRLISRGAAVICATNQRGIDLLIPILIGDVLRKESVTAILIQVKNDKSYTEKPARWLFDAMDPFRVGLFSKGVVPLPVIRMVFAVASKESAVNYLQRGYIPRLQETVPGRAVPAPGLKTSFTAYDIWCSGITSRTFRAISPDQDVIYEDILLRARSLANPYTPMEKPSVFEKERGDMRRAMNPGVAALSQHHQRYIDDTQDSSVDVILDDSIPETQQEQFIEEQKSASATRVYRSW
ncbi:hypothetical protein CPB85DRAFT_1285026 [Mucidula mucida]|nr:hypothetical protein CPB85DRAFT_1285026 [Mucidula mucida]